MKKKTKKVLCWVGGGLVVAAVVAVGFVVAYAAGNKAGQTAADASWELAVRIVEGLPFDPPVIPSS